MNPPEHEKPRIWPSLWVILLTGRITLAGGAPGRYRRDALCYWTENREAGGVILKR
jgi:hypothetical protein